jgi:hypothetical protein
MSFHLRDVFAKGFGLMLALSVTLLPARGNEVEPSDSGITNSPAMTEEVSAVNAAQLQAMVQLQAQQEATLRALELTRSEIASSLAASISNNMVHLNTMTELLAQQRAQDMKTLRDSNRTVLAIVVGLSGLLLLSILFLNVTSIRAINRLATVFEASALLPPTDSGADVSRQMLLFPGEEGQRQLGSALMQLQSRIQALEHVATKTPGRADASKSTIPLENGAT